MKLPRDLSGADVIKVLCKHYGYCRLLIDSLRRGQYGLLQQCRARIAS
jgi:hypothetical protein